MEITVDDSELLAKLKDLIPQDPQAVKQGLLNVAYKIQKSASRLCPVDTGRLRSSIAVATNEDVYFEGDYPEDAITPAENEFEVKIGTNTFYAIYVEFGTRKMAARPFLRPAFEWHRNSILEEVYKEMKRK